MHAFYVVFTSEQLATGGSPHGKPVLSGVPLRARSTCTFLCCPAEAFFSRASVQPLRLQKASADSHEVTK